MFEEIDWSKVQAEKIYFTMESISIHHLSRKEMNYLIGQLNALCLP
jgi:hypothetical protein